MKCPKNHEVGTKFGAIACGPDACAGEVTTWSPETTQAPKKSRKKVELPIPYVEVNKAVRETNKALRAENLDPGLTDEAAEQVERMKKSIGKYEARRAFLKTPDVSKLSQEEAKDWVNKKLDSLAPEAVSRIEYALKLGDDDVSLKAAYEILDRTGFGRKDGGGLPGAPIIIQVAGADGTTTTTTTYKPSWMIDAKKEEKK